MGRSQFGAFRIVCLDFRERGVCLEDGEIASTNERARSTSRAAQVLGLPADMKPPRALACIKRGGVGSELAKLFYPHAGALTLVLLLLRGAFTLKTIKLMKLVSSPLADRHQPCCRDVEFGLLRFPSRRRPGTRNARGAEWNFQLPCPNSCLVAAVSVNGYDFWLIRSKNEREVELGGGGRSFGTGSEQMAGKWVWNFRGVNVNYNCRKVAWHPDPTATGSYCP